jgi:hypothetical protein
MNTFIYEMGMAEPNLGKRRKIDSLQLQDDEWDRLGHFITLLTVRLILCLLPIMLTI